MSAMDQSKVEAIANDVETKLFNLNGDINPKYKNKYRSLVFNLKDIKNQVWLTFPACHSSVSWLASDDDEDVYTCVCERG